MRASFIELPDGTKINKDMGVSIIKLINNLVASGKVINGIVKWYDNGGTSTYAHLIYINGIHFASSCDGGGGKQFMIYSDGENKKYSKDEVIRRMKLRGFE